jgi:hypothetical protein
MCSGIWTSSTTNMCIRLTGAKMAQAECGHKHSGTGHDFCKLIQCTNCNKAFWQSGYEMLASRIMQRKPICSYECNKALGQVN